MNGETKGEEEGRSQEQSSNTDAQDLGSSDHAATMIWVESWGGFGVLCFGRSAELLLAKFGSDDWGGGERCRMRVRRRRRGRRRRVYWSGESGEASEG